VIDWGRRILDKKPSYGHRERGQDAYAPSTTLSLAEHVRMQKKVDRVGLLQTAELKRIKEGKPLRTSFPDVAKFDRVEISGGHLMEYGTFARSASGRAVFQAILPKARRFSGGAVGSVLLVQLDGATAGGSHMLGLHLYGADLLDVHLFDPNVGEFRFMNGAGDHLWRFCDDLMTDLYTNENGELLFDSFEVNRLSTSSRLV
jgi:hypothetical protein